MSQNGGILWFIGLGLALILTGVGLHTHANAADMVVYKSPTCGCCKAWIKHLEENGFTVEAKDVADMTAMKRQLGVPAGVESCHTATIEGYLVEGHVPAADLRRLLKEKPPAQGIAVPEMPVGSPGMEVPGVPAAAYKTLLFTRDGQTKLFTQH